MHYRNFNPFRMSPALEKNAHRIMIVPFAPNLSVLIVALHRFALFSSPANNRRKINSI